MHRYIFVCIQYYGIRIAGLLVHIGKGCLARTGELLLNLIINNPKM